MAREGGVTKKKSKDPNAPKKALSAYFLWLKENRARFAKPGMKVGDVAKAAAEEWRSLDDKAEWNKKAEEDKIRYREELEEKQSSSLIFDLTLGERVDDTLGRLNLSFYACRRLGGDRVRLTKFGGEMDTVCQLICPRNVEVQAQTSSRLCRRFEKKVVIISGGTRGIGLAIAQRLVEEGASVIVASRCQQNVNEAVDYLRSLPEIHPNQVCGQVCHAGCREQREELIDVAEKKFGRLDVLISNAGVNPAVGHIMEVSGSQWDKLCDINIKAGFELCRRAVPLMEWSGGGVVIFTSSLAAYRVPGAFNAYGTTKSALSMLTTVLSQELAHKRIRVNSIVPGTVDGAGMSRMLWDTTHKWHHKVKSAAHGSKGLFGRFAKPSEIASSVAYLCSDDASFVTGENHLVMGGIDARL
ncbi:unnamed protein product [Bursaphelenchus xylophilus]|uniref:(pine wood nematode) hypothetical protein n=1 Tax=Bursaphelenchus xylophilus TaxID=6326 RepID=A0A1I7RP90_BURXY|nr:unnamed protein product [Bursaphelenchus xylophilus]CAG9095608.1 unnamed protein product [Bursaphelenchus xylophilus]